MSRKKPDPNTLENIEVESKSARRDKPSLEMTRRDTLRSIGTGTIAAALSGAFTPPVAAEAGCSAPGPVGKQPYESIRIIEQSETLAGRLAGMLFADQGAEVIVERVGHAGRTELDDAYFDRGKLVLASGTRADLASADVIIVDGVKPVERAPHQIVLRITAAVPGDEEYGYLPADCSEDLLNALVRV